MENEEIAVAFKTTQAIDQIIEQLMLYAIKSPEPIHATALGMVIADLKRVKQLVLVLENKESLERIATLDLCNHIFLRMLRRLKITNKHFPFNVYISHLFLLDYEHWKNN